MLPSSCPSVDKLYEFAKLPLLSEETCKVAEVGISNERIASLVAVKKE